ncbi:MAG: FG-GAP-like repeat-containing protein [Sandaracinaceae bacterium]
MRGLPPSLVALSLLLLATGCDCSAPPEVTPCTGDSECAADEACVDEVCVPRTTTDSGPTPDTGPMGCEAGEVTCGATCCSGGMVCLAGTCAMDCGSSERCGDACCGDGQECLDNACVAECEDEANRCGDACCGSAQACLSNACVDLGVECTVTEECDIEDICLPSLGRCVPRDAVEVCEFRPPVGELDPVLGCRWIPPAGEWSSYDDVVMTPAVVNLTDDNGDGVTDAQDVPDIVFVSSDHQANSCCSFKGVIRIVSGACNADGTMNTIATLPTPHTDVSGGVAVGNLHPDSMDGERTPEIVAFLGGGGTTGGESRPFIGLVAFRRTADDGSAWEEMWRNVAVPNLDHALAAAKPSIADLNGDGQPEVVLGNVALNGIDGTVLWDGRVTVGPSAGMGHNAFLGPTSTIADIDLDGVVEVIAGNTVYDGRDGMEEWTFDYMGSSASVCSSRYSCDGYNAVGNFDDDPEGEIVAVRVGEVYVLNHDGTLLHQVDIPWDDCGASLDPPQIRNESGPPTVADFDGDGRPEIGTASADFYVVIDFDCTGDPLPTECESENILWTVANQDCSSRATGSSVFDFEGDGRAEVVYADERTFRIFDGQNGDILYEDDTHRSNTRMEMPIVVDVDNDGQAEVVIPEPNSNAELGGIEVLDDAANNWVRTRRIWNQHTYHVTNVTEDGQIPRDEEENWRNSRLNNFRQNVQPGGLFDATDLVVQSIELGACDLVEGARIEVTVRNDGAIGAAPGVPVHAVVTPGGGGATIDLGVQLTTTNLLPGRTETLVFLLPVGDVPSDLVEYDVTATVDSDGAGGSRYNECNEDNNVGMTETAFRWCSIA